MNTAGRSTRLVAAGLVAIAVLGMGVFMHRGSDRTSRSPVAPTARLEESQVQSLSAEEQQARKLASLGISAQPPEVQARYRAAIAEANQRAVTTRRAALASLREARERLAAEHPEAERLAAIDEQIQRSENQLARAQSVSDSE